MKAEHGLYRALKNYDACIFSERTALKRLLLRRFQGIEILRQQKNKRPLKWSLA
jgi:hypothetical protein